LTESKEGTHTTPIVDPKDRSEGLGLSAKLKCRGRVMPRFKEQTWTSSNFGGGRKKSY